MASGGSERVTAFHAADLVESKPGKLERWSPLRVPYPPTVRVASVPTSHPLMKQQVSGQWSESQGKQTLEAETLPCSFVANEEDEVVRPWTQLHL